MGAAADVDRYNLTHQHVVTNSANILSACRFARLIGYDGGMYGLSKELDLSFFVGKTLSSITFGINIIHFGFDGGVSISLESSYQHQRKSDANQIGTVQSVFKCQNSSLMQFLEHSVVSAAAGEDGTLSLTFDHGDVLSFLENPGPYECYEFTDGKNAWIV
jgi:hypothetical protein